MPKTTGRSHVSQACDTCRRRKVRCERLAQTTRSCRQCSESGAAPCTYDMPVSKRGPSKKSTETRLPHTTSDASEASLTPNGPGHNLVPHHSPELDTPSQYSDCSQPHRIVHPLGQGSHGTDTDISPPTQPPALLSQTALCPDTIPNILSLCSHTLMDLVLQDYLDFLYPTIPVIHIPSFKEQYETKSQTRDASFLCLLFSLFAMVISMLPRRFEHYRLVDARFALEFLDRRKLVDRVQKLVLESQDVGYFDNLTITKWASAYCRMAAYACIGLVPRAMMLRAEAEAIVAQLACHRVASYLGLNEIEAQLRRKALWMTATARLHKSVFDVFCGREDDLCCLANNELHLLVPHEVDDDYITAESVTPQLENLPSLVTGFNAEKRLLQCILCTEKKTTNTTSHDIEAISEKLTYILDDLPPALELWRTNIVIVESSTSALRFSQYETQRANIHATHLWAQTLLLDRRLAALPALTPTAALQMSIMETKADVCRQLLHLVLTSKLASLEPNGHILVLKIRQVAVSLVNDNACTQRSAQARNRVDSYLQKFAAILADLDHNYAFDLQSSSDLLAS